MKVLREVGFSGKGGISGQSTSVTSAEFQMGLMPFPLFLCSWPGWEEKFFKWRFRPFPLGSEPCNVCFYLIVPDLTAVPRNSLLLLPPKASSAFASQQMSPGTPAHQPGNDGCPWSGELLVLWS